MRDDYFGYIGALGETLRGLSKWSEMYQQQINAIDLASALQPLAEIGTQHKEIINSVVPQQVEMLKTLEVPWNRELLTNTLSLQMEAISSALQCVQTEEISSLLESFNQASWMSGMDEFVRNIESQSFAQAANLAFLCKAGSLDSFLKDGYPSGMKSFIRDVHKRTADRLAANENIEASYKKR